MLDMMQVAGQIHEAGRQECARRARAAEETHRAVAHAQGMEAERWSEQVRRIRASKTSWLVAHTPELPASRFCAPAAPDSYRVIATDGSQIAPDRHEGTGGCYLLNVGRVVLSYGTNAPRSRLDTQPEIVFADEDADENAQSADLAFLRFGRELAALSGLIAEVRADVPTVALTDGSLIAWFLDDAADASATKRTALDALLDALDTGRDCGTPVVGYISDPGARDIVNALRITLCAKEPVHCFRCPEAGAGEPLACASIRRATDAALFAGLLEEGERSPVFTARGQTTGFSHVLQRYGDHWIGFFYLNVGAEIARIEIPAWVAADPVLVERVHAVCLDQAIKGRGYPVALAEAHERAVVQGADRQAFLNLLRRSLIREGNTPVACTRKSLAKRTRAV